MPKSYLALLSLLIAALVIAPLGDAEAKRLGGGRSFGSKPAYSSPYQRSQIQPKRVIIPAKTTPTRQADHQALPNRTGLSGWLAPLLVGGLLGSLFLGSAFEHLNLADLLVFAGLAFVLFKLARRSRPVEETPYYSTPGEPVTRPFDTDLLFNQSNPKQAAGISLVDTPADFDLDEFLEQAKQIFRQLQAAWSQGELADIRGLTTDEAFMEIKTQKETDGVGPVEVLALQAQLLDYQETSDAQTAAVLFTASIREDQQDPEQIEEIWHFVRAKLGFNSSWRLDGIQQIEG